MNKFLELLEESVITQGALTLLVAGAWVYIIITTGESNPDLTNIMLLVMGFYFGGKAPAAAIRVQKTLVKPPEEQTYG